MVFLFFCVFLVVSSYNLVMKNMKEIIKNYNQINSKCIINRGGIVHDFYHLKWYQKWLIISDYWYNIKEDRGFSKNIIEIIDYYLY